MNWFSGVTQKFGRWLAGTPAPWDDFWYTSPMGLVLASGGRISVKQARRLAAAAACERVLSVTMASLPLKVYRFLPDGGKEEARDHPLYPVLSRKPNSWQSRFEWVRMLQSHLEMRGNAYSLIISMASAIDQLIPLHPDTVTPKRGENGGIVYEWQQPDGTLRRLAQDEVFHLRGLSCDGIVGLSPITASADVFSSALDAQDYASRHMRNDSRSTGVLEVPGTMKETAIKNLRDSWQDAQTGINRGKVAVLEGGIKYNAIGVSPKDSQLLEQKQYSRSEIASIFGVPPHKIGDLSRATFSNIEEQNIEFAQDAIRPRAVQWEQAILRDLILDPDVYFAEFTLDALLRGNTLDRYMAYGQAIRDGWLTRNEARISENKNPIEGLDEPLLPLNMTDGTAAPGDPRRPPNREARVRSIVQAAAQRVVQKEIGALRKLVDAADSGDAFRSGMLGFYSTHISEISSRLGVHKSLAGDYVSRHAEELLSVCGNGTVNSEAIEGVLDTWRSQANTELVRLALED
ncbi:MAG: phage portal protein [Acidobacteria bacterium]|nr:phage portal protein [Acidobacteriota bacterium]